MRLQFPPDYGTKGCALIAVDITLFPIFAGLIAVMEEERFWLPADYPAAYQAVADMEASMSLLCVQDLVESNNRLYRLLDWGFNGTVYDAGADPPSTITPAIPDVPSTSTELPGLIHTLVRNVNLLDNSLNGADNVDFSGGTSLRDYLQQIIDGIAADDTDLAEVLIDLETVIALLA